MRIAITSNYKIGNETGTAHVSEELCRELSKKNKVTYFCVGEKYKKSKLNDNLTIFTFPSVEINNLVIPFITPRATVNMFKYLDKFKPDIVHAQNPFLICSLAQMWARTNKVPYLVTFHHIPTQAIEHLLPKFSKNIVTKIAEDIYKEISLKGFFEKSDGVIALNQTIRKSIRKVNKKIPVKIINNGLDLSKLLRVESKKSTLANVEFMFMGSYTERKNQKYLIKVFAHLPKNYRLTLYGSKTTGGPYLRELESLIKKLEIENVDLNDYTKNKSEAFANTDYLVSASVKEAQSLVIIEALASGKPVIGLKNETTAELINESNGVVLPQKTSPKEFAKQILKLITEKDYKETSRNARKDSNNFRIEKVAPRLLKFYKEFVSKT